MHEKTAISIGLAFCLLVSCVGFSGCSAESQKPSEQTHTHSYVNGVCPEDGAYETDFILKGRVPESLKTAPANIGTIEEISYTTHSYYLESLPENEGKEIVLTKTAEVYLPYGYDACPLPLPRLSLLVSPFLGFPPFP